MVTASEATQLGYGGVTFLNQACWLASYHQYEGSPRIDEISSAGESYPEPRRWRGGDWRHGPGLIQLLDSLVEPLTCGEPEPSLATLKTLLRGFMANGAS